MLFGEWKEGREERESERAREKHQCESDPSTGYLPHESQWGAGTKLSTQAGGLDQKSNPQPFGAWSDESKHLETPARTILNNKMELEHTDNKGTGRQNYKNGFMGKTQEKD